MAAAQAELLADQAALARIAPGEIVALTKAATVAFARPEDDPGQHAANRRVIDIAEPCCAAAAASDAQYFVAAFVQGHLAGFVIATRHAADDLELDWLMVHPDHHGADLAPALMERGMAWLGLDRPQWLGVIRHNERAIRFYRRFGFEIDADATTAHAVPHWVMRRPAGAAL